MSGCDQTFNLWKAFNSFTFNATAGDTLDLSYTRVSGNRNLGLVVLSAENERFCQASLVTAGAQSESRRPAPPASHARAS